MIPSLHLLCKTAAVPGVPGVPGVFLWVLYSFVFCKCPFFVGISFSSCFVYVAWF